MNKNEGFIMRNSIFFAIIATCCFGSLICMDQQPARLTSQQQESAGPISQLPQDVVINITSFCEPKDRCALRCTGKHLNRQLQGSNYPQDLCDEDGRYLHDEKYTNYKKFEDLIHNHFKSLKNGISSIQYNCFGIDQTWGFLALPTIGTQYILKSIFGTPINKPLFCLSLLQFSSLAFGLSVGLRYDENHGYYFACYGLFSLLLKRPAAYSYGIGVYLMNKNNIIKAAKKVFWDKERYLNSDFHQFTVRSIDTLVFWNHLKAKSLIDSAILHALPEVKHPIIRHDE